MWLVLCIVGGVNEQNSIVKQECIPVGCILPACCPYLPACTAPRGVYLPGGCTCWGCTCPGVYLPMGGVPVWDGCTCPGSVPVWGVYLPGGSTCLGVYLPGGTCPGTPPCEQNDRQVQKYYLAPNFVCGQ